MEECPICRRPESVSSVRIDSRDAYEITCERCGKYRATGRAHAMLSGNDINPRTRLKLTWATRQASELGTVLELAPENIGEVAASVVEPYPPSRKLDHLILLLGNRTAAFGKGVSLIAKRDWPLVCAKDEGELNALLGTLGKEGYAVQSEGLCLTTTGWERFAQLNAEHPKSTAAFVAMQFSDEMRGAYDEGFYPALYGLGYDPIRVDREQYLGKIDDFIIASIRKSALLVADFTGMRTGVFFEAGLGLGLGIPVVWTCRADWLDRLKEHFDTRQYNHLAWTTPAELDARLRIRIEAAVVSRPKPRR